MVLIIDMTDTLTPTNITFILGLLAIIFSIFNYFKNPQINLDKKQALDKEDVDNKATTLARELEIANRESDRRFSEIGLRMDKALELAMNHTHTVDVKCDKVIEGLNLLSIQVAKLETKIDERVPHLK